MPRMPIGTKVRCSCKYCLPGDGCSYPWAGMVSGWEPNVNGGSYLVKWATGNGLSEGIHGPDEIQHACGNEGCDGPSSVYHECKCIFYDVRKGSTKCAKCGLPLPPEVRLDS